MNILKKATNLNFEKIIYYFPAIIFFVSLLFNILYFDWENAPIFSPDSYTYLKFAESISNFETPNIFSRTPVYPLYLLIFLNNLKIAAVGQIIIGALSNVILYLIGLKLIKRKGLIFAIVLMISSNFFISSYNSFLLTECLSIFLLLLSLYIHILILSESIRKKIFITSIVIDFFLIFIRPNLMLLPIIFLIFTFFYFFLYERKSLEFKKIKSFFFFGIFLNIFFISGWCYLNWLQNGYFTISRVGDTNLLGKLIQYDMVKENKKLEIIPEPAQKIIEIKNKISSANTSSDGQIQVAINFRNGDNIINAIINKLKIIKWRFIIPKLLNNFYYKIDPHDILTEFSKTSKDYYTDLKLSNKYFLEKNKGEFFSKTLKIIPIAAMSPGNFRYNPKYIAENSIFKVNINFFYFLSLISPLTITILFFCFARFIFIRDKKKIAVLGMILVSISYVLINISALSYNDYNRLKTPVVPLVQVVSLLIIFIIFKKIFLKFVIKSN